MRGNVFRFPTLEAAKALGCCRVGKGSLVFQLIVLRFEVFTYHIQGHPEEQH